jgi:hypothetical protein
MAKGTVLDEVSVLKFFETGPIEKVEVVFNIVSEKMRERLTDRAPEDGEPDRCGSVRKRRAGNVDTGSEEITLSPKL